jgi:hypothetical protein
MFQCVLELCCLTGEIYCARRVSRITFIRYSYYQGLENQIISKSLFTKKTKGSEKESQNGLLLAIPEGGWFLFYLFINLIYLG